MQVDNGEVSVYLPVDHVMTLSTKTGQMKGEYTPPASAPFPVPYNDNFESNLHKQNEIKLTMYFIRL